VDGKGNRRGKENEGNGIERKRVSTNFLKLGPARKKISNNSNKFDLLEFCFPSTFQLLPTPEE